MQRISKVGLYILINPLWVLLYIALLVGFDGEFGYVQAVLCGIFVYSSHML